MSDIVKNFVHFRSTSLNRMVKFGWCLSTATLTKLELSTAKISELESREITIFLSSSNGLDYYRQTSSLDTFQKISNFCCCWRCLLIGCNSVQSLSLIGWNTKAIQVALVKNIKTSWLNLMALTANMTVKKAVFVAGKHLIVFLLF